MTHRTAHGPLFLILLMYAFLSENQHPPRSRLRSTVGLVVSRGLRHNPPRGLPLGDCPVTQRPRYQMTYVNLTQAVVLMPHGCVWVSCMKVETAAWIPRRGSRPASAEAPL